MALGNVLVKDAADLVRKTMQAVYCMDLDTFADVMNKGVIDPHTREKWDFMQRNVIRWFCDMDSSEAQKFMNYVLTK